MRQKTNVFKRGLSFLLSICMVLGVIVIPPHLGGQSNSHVHADSSSGTHDCTLAAEGFNLDQATMSFFVANGINVGDYDFAYGPLIVSATEEIHWTGTLTIPDGMFIGICTGGFDYSVGDIVFEGKGGVYYLDCSKTLTPHKDCQAFTDGGVVYLTQDVVTMYEDWAKAYGVTVPVLNENLTLALAEDITFTTNVLAPATGYIRNFCKNGYNLTFADGVDFSAFGGTVNILDCQNMPKLVHDCNVAHYSTDPVTQENIATYMAQLPYIPAGTIVCVHLAEDVVYNAEVKIPDGVIVAVCLNGSTLTGINVDTTGNTSGGFFTYDCDEHTCRVGGESMDATYVLTQDIVDFLEEAYKLDDDFVENYLHCVLAEDVTLRSEMWRPEGGSSISFCKNGYTLNDEAHLNLSAGDVLYFDCNKTQMKDISHESLFFGNSSFPMAQETLNDFPASLAPYLYTYKYSPYTYNYWSYLDRNGNICYISSVMSNDTISPITMTTDKGSAYYFTAGGENLWNYTTNAYDYIYTYSGGGTYNISSNSSMGYTAYLLPAMAEDGSIYLAMVNSSKISHDAETSQYFVTYSEQIVDENGYITYNNKEIPVYLWDMDYTRNNLTVTIEDVTYYLACGGEQGFYLEKVENYDSEKLLGYYDYRQRFNGEDGIYVFHLAEDIAWDGTLSVPAGYFVIILTNGHTATGAYEHNNYGGVYIFNDDMHICPSAPEVPVTISSDFIDLLILMNGGAIDMPARQYVALGENLTEINPTFVLPSTTTLYICNNGYTVSDAVVAQLTSNGGRVEFIDCDDLSHETCDKLGDNVAQPVNQNLMVNFYQDATGRFALGSGTYYIYLTSDIKLNRTLVIPAGVELHICLNGYTITSPQIITSGGTSFNEENECNGAVRVMPGAYLAVYDCSPSETGCITPQLENMNGWGALAAYAVCNEGVFVLNSGNLLGMVSFINSGDATINGGNIYGVLGAVAQGSEMSESVGGSGYVTEPSLLVNDGTITSVLIGVMGQDGEIVINQSEIEAGAVGVGSNFDGDVGVAGADLVLNGGSINVGSVMIEDFISVLDMAGVYMDPEDIESIMGEVSETENGELIVESDELYGVITNSNITISEDVEITLHPGAVDYAEKSADLMLGDGASVTVTPSTKGEGNGNEFSASGNVNALPENSENTFGPGKGEAFEKDENGELIIVDVTTTAQLAGRTLTLNGLIRLNIFFTLTDSFINNENARVRIEFAGEITEYKVSDLKKSGSYRFASIGVSAKDYCEKPYIVFTDGTVEWTSEKDVDTSVNGYLEQLLADTSGAYDSAKDLANNIRNYCMAASSLFLGTEYTPTSEMQENMSNIDMEIFKDYEFDLEGDSEKVTMPGATLFLEEGTTIRIYLQAAQGVDMSTVDVYVDGVAKKATLYSSAQCLYYVEIENISAKNLADIHTVTVDGVTLSYSAISYCFTVFRTKDTQPAALLDLCRALYGYYEAAYKYEINK